MARRRSEKEEWARRRAYKTNPRDNSGVAGRWSPCPFCGKRTYWTRQSAKAASKQGVGGRPYECMEPGTGRWHLTTIDAESRAWFRDQYEKEADSDG